MRLKTLSLALLVTLSSLQGQEIQFQILSTTDMHGRILPSDTYSLLPVNQGWAKIASLIKEERAKNPNTLLLDGGDTIQGEPINYVKTYLNPELPEPSIDIMNALGYHAMAVGNHEYNFGLSHLRQVQKQARFSFLSANTLVEKTGRSAFDSYRLFNSGALKVAVVGFTTPWIPKWDEPSKYLGLKFEDIVQTAKILIPKIRVQEKPDLLIVLLHSGLGESPGNVGDENVVFRLIDQVSGIDGVVSGHTHRPIAQVYKNIPIVQAGAHGQALAKISFNLMRVSGKWAVTRRIPTLLTPTDETPLDSQVLALTETLREQTERYLDTPATNLAVPLDARWSRMEPSPIMDLIHHVQLKATGAELSAASCVFPKLFIPKGPTSVRQFYAINTYEDHVVTLKLTGKQVKLWLEHSASAYRFSYEPNLFKEDVPFYNIDFMSGVSYIMDLTRPEGDRIRDLTYQGSPIDLQRIFTVAVTTYRAFGGGGFTEAVKFKGQPIYTSSQSKRNLLLQYVLERPNLTIPSVSSWKIVPMIDRGRLLTK
ncbi:MAG: bifunctional metallophosphatase/5'-nucleotidase [Holophagaceae bacterium]